MKRVSRSLTGEGPKAAFSLAELVIALAVAATVTVAAWPCCWSLAHAARDNEAAAETVCDLGFAGRILCAEIRSADGLAAAPATSGAGRLTLAKTDPAGGPETTVTYGYDQGRRLLWRGSSSSYALEHCVVCRFAYFDDGGRELLPAAGGFLDPLDSARVVRVRLTVQVETAAGSAVATWDAALRHR